MQIDPSIFKSYDIRGIYGQNLNEEIAEKIGRGYAKYLNFPQQVIVARDGRVSGQSMKTALIKGLTSVGVNVLDIDMASTDLFYYACQMKRLPGISNTASHNPKEYTGFKMVKKIPHLLSGEEGIKQIKEYITNDQLPDNANTPGTISTWQPIEEFVDFSVNLINKDQLKPFTIHADTANGMVGPMLEILQTKLPQIKFIPMYWEVDGNFPNHGGDPLQAENRKEIETRVPRENSDLGIMFDPDGDRFFVIDKTGRFISGDFMTAILSKYFIKRNPGATIIYDIRASKIVPDTIEKLGGTALANRVGHTYIKARMEKEGAVFGGEVTGHYYHKDFFLCDSGLITLIYLLEYLSSTKIPLEKTIDQMESEYHISGEINSKVPSVPDKLKEIEDKYGPDAITPVEHMDGVTLEMGDWRFNVRGSNTQPLIRLNLEAKTEELMEQKRDELLTLIRNKS